MLNSLPPGTYFVSNSRGLPGGGWAFLDLTHTVYLYIETFFRRYTVKGPGPVVVCVASLCKPLNTELSISHLVSAFINRLKLQLISEV